MLLYHKSVGGDDENCSMFDDSPDVDEEALIEEKTEYEKTFIRNSDLSSVRASNLIVSLKPPQWK